MHYGHDRVQYMCRSLFLEPSADISDGTLSALTVLADSGLTPPLQFDARGA